MKKLLAFVLALMLAGCGLSGDPGLALRQQLQTNPCAFQAEITADYGDSLCKFTLDCQGDDQGNITFSVSSPESIQGITGTIRGGKGALTFEDTALSFPLLADGQLSPISAPWLLLRVLRSGNLLSQGKDGSFTRLTIRDGYQEGDLLSDVWLDESGTPTRAEFLHKGRKILSIQLLSFRTGSENAA